MLASYDSTASEISLYLEGEARIFADQHRNERAQLIELFKNLDFDSTSLINAIFI
jgi:hypothetical protein